MVFPMTQERENETTKTKVFTLLNPRMNIQVFKVTPISSLSKSSGEPKSLAEDIHFLGVDFHRKYQTPHQLIEPVYTHKHISPLTYMSSIHQNR